VKVVCAWCKRVIGERSDPSLADRLVSHGICDTCARLVEEYEPVRLGALLDRFEGPVLLIDAEGRVIAGNANASRVLDKAPANLCGRLGGEVIECVHSLEDGGCGKTVHCTGCTIRGTVRHTLETGESRWGVEAYQHVFTPTGVERMRVLITTERWCGRVLLRIDALTPARVA
jgi:PAS domain-containing protein